MIYPSITLEGTIAGAIERKKMRDVLDQYDRSMGLAPSETQSTISKWAETTFGTASSNARVAARANEEMAELLRVLTADDTNVADASKEIADVFIVLYRLADRMGVDIHEVIDQKMAVNRAREWKRDGTGHGYHVRVK